MARYGAYRLLPTPWATMAVNVLGGLLMGLLMGWLLSRAAGDSMRLLLGVGLLGGFTTFSAFSLDAVHLLERGQWGMMIFYVAGSVLLSILGVAGGMMIGRSLFE